jgi:hypothetical protein
MRLYLFCFVLLSIFFKTGFAQESFVPGWYVTFNSDTVKGYIFIGREKPFTSFQYKNSSGSQNRINISLDSCKMVSYENETIENWLVSRDMSYIDNFNFDIINSDSVITAAIPLKQLYKGPKLSLYYYNDIKDHFFVYDGKYMQELSLTYRYLTDFEKMQYTRNVPRYYVNTVYKNQLRALMEFNLTKKQKIILEHAEYKKADLIQLFKSLNSED